MKSLKLFSLIVVVAMMSACGPDDPTTVRFTSADNVSVAIDGEKNFDVAVQVKNGKGETTFVYDERKPDWVTAVPNGANKVILQIRVPADETERTVEFTIKATNNKVTTDQNFKINIGGGAVGGDGDGSEANPYSAAQVLQFFEDGEVKRGVWVKGYIVGAVATTISNGADYGTNGTNNVIKKPEDVVFGTTGIRTTAVLIADSKTETDYTKCVVIQISMADGQTDYPANLRSDLNLVDNPQNLGEPLAVRGNLARYFSVPAVRDVNDYRFEKPEGPPPSDDVLSVAEAIATQNSQLHWVQGFIVGGVLDDPSINNIDANNAATALVWSAVNVRPTVIMLADSPSETDYTKIVLVNLPTGVIRTALNLVDNPSNIGVEVKVQGKTRTYFGLPGVRDLEGFEIIE